MKFKRSFLLSSVFVLLFSIAAKAEIFHAYLTGAQEVPANSSTATGYARFFVNPATGAFTFTLVFTGLSSNQTASHIHAPAAIGANTGVALNLGVLTPPGTAGTITGSGTMTPTQLSQIRAHQGYVNVHSGNFPGGEIRGQLGVKRPVDFDGDGRQDFSVLRFPTVAPQTIVYWNLNSTTGAEISVGFGDAARDFPAPGDYDGDGKDDLAVYRAGATAGTQSFFYYISSASNTFVSQQFGLSGDQIVARDYDGDGKTDVAVFRRGASQGAQAFFLYRGSDPAANPTNGVFYIPFGTTGDTANTLGDTPVPGDYDGDGKFDFAVYRFGGLVPNNTFIVLRSSDNSLQFQQWGNFQTDWIVPGDYDGDGKYDFAAARTGATASAPMVWWILQSGTGAVRTQPFGISSDLPTQGDYDGDARADLSVVRQGATLGSPNNFWVLRSFDGIGQQTQWGVRGDFTLATFDSR